jgi:hypothetical protein
MAMVIPTSHKDSWGGCAILRTRTAVTYELPSSFMQNLHGVMPVRVMTKQPKQAQQRCIEAQIPNRFQGGNESGVGLQAKPQTVYTTQTIRR